MVGVSVGEVRKEAAAAVELNKKSRAEDSWDSVKVWVGPPAADLRPVDLDPSRPGARGNGLHITRREALKWSMNRGWRFVT